MKGLPEQREKVFLLDEHPDENEVKDLTRLQEEHFLALFWQSFHCVYPLDLVFVRMFIRLAGRACIPSRGLTRRRNIIKA
jgi:hypothetical protein